MPVVKLTQNFIDNNLHCPVGKKRIEYCCNELRGLIVEARATNQGHGTYYLRYKDSSGKTAYSKLGVSTEVSLAAARSSAKQLKAEIQLGADPRAEVKAQKEVLTFDDFFHNHYLPYVKPRKRSWKRDEELYRLRIKAVFGKVRLNLIARHQIQLFHTSLRNEGLAFATADLHLKFLKHAFALSIDWKLLKGENPASRIPMFNADNRVENLLSDAELERLLTVLRTDRSRVPCRLAIFLMSTGARAREATEAKWKDIDKEGRRWHVPMTNSKSKRARWVPLNDSAMLALKEVGTEGEYEHVFVNRRTGKPYLNIAKTWDRLRKTANLPHLRIHDLRHGFATMLASAGRSLIEIGDLLGHAKGSAAITGRYIHLSQGRLREASNVASLKIMGTVQLTPKQEVAKNETEIINQAGSDAKSDGVVSAAA